jgi:RNA polymerase sigma-70 factor (ECF subfamily)
VRRGLEGCRRLIRRRHLFRTEGVPFTLGAVRDEVVLARLRAGDQRALAVVYDAHGAMVYGLACTVTGDASLSEEIAADVFVELWHHPELVEGTLRAHLAVVTHRRAVEIVRHRPSATGGRPEGLEIGALLDRLPDDQRAALVLAYFDGRTHHEVAELLGLDDASAKRCLGEALRALRDHLAGGLGVS